MKRLLFVDDDPNVLMALERSMHSMCDEWSMEFVESGEMALAALGRQPFDAIVSDMRMPGMTGLELLNTIQDRYPQTIRILLSGQSDRESMLTSIARTHQYLCKPCDVRQLRTLLSETMALGDLLDNSAIKAFVSRLTSIPSLPSLVLELDQLLHGSDPSPLRIGKIIAQDMGMTARILQVANSALYGLRSEVTRPEEAVIRLGLDTIQSLVLSFGVFSSLNSGMAHGFPVEELWHHSNLTGSMAQAIARMQGVSESQSGAYLTAGLLHDIGKLVISACDSQLYRRILDTVASSGAAQWEIEQEQLGCTHAEIGAFLLGIWGLPVSIVEAVAWHHRPSASPVNTFSAVAAVHVADAFQEQLPKNGSGNQPALDFAFLERAGLADRLDVWAAELGITLTEEEKAS